VVRAAEFAAEQLSATRSVLDPVRRDRESGHAFSALAAALNQRGADARRGVAAAFREYERAVASLRAQVVHALVDEEGETLSGLARRMGLSRQAVTRLYEAGKAAAESRGTEDQSP
jgi:DNA invertase Pin-like site-specific DNA recombinase